MINLELLKNKEIKIVGHRVADFDSIVSGILLEYVLNKLDIDAKFVLQDKYIDTYFLEVCEKIGFKYDFKFGGKSEDVLFLVDHTDFYDNEVIGCFDHHPTVCDIKNNYVQMDKTCCAKIIEEWAREVNVDIPKELEILVVYACYLDSLSFKSTKALKEDKDWCLSIIEKYNLNQEEIAIYGYGLTNKDRPATEYFKNGLKTFAVGENVLKSSYLVVDNDDIDIKEAVDILSLELVEDVVMWCLIISNIKFDSTKIVLITKEYYLEQNIDKLLSRGKNIIPAIMNFLSFNNDGTITQKLIDKNIQVATMESCTSGLIASNITDYEGASAILKGSSITYSNKAKIDAGVSASVINVYGVYSAETALDMAWNAKRYFKADIGIGITGSFGNVDPANKDSIAGIIYFHIATKKFNKGIKLTYKNINVSRKEMKQKTVDIVLGVLSCIVEKM